MQSVLPPDLDPSIPNKRAEASRPRQARDQLGAPQPILGDDDARIGYADDVGTHTCCVEHRLVQVGVGEHLPSGDEPANVPPGDRTKRIANLLGRLEETADEACEDPHHWPIRFGIGHIVDQLRSGRALATRNQRDYAAGPTAPARASRGMR